MKKLLFVITVITFASCSREKLELIKAKNVVESLIKTCDKEDYKNVSQYYSEAMLEGESEQVRTEKLKKLREVMGSVQSFDMVQSRDSIYNDFPALVLTYKVKHDYVVALEMFTVIIEKGEYRIAQQNVQSFN